MTEKYNILTENEQRTITKAKIKRAESANLKNCATNELHSRLSAKYSEMPASF